MTPDLPEPIAAYIARSNAHDADGCSAWFTHDAVVRDEGREMEGVAAVREWMRVAFEKYRHSLEVLSSTKVDGDTVVACHVSGNFPGSPVDLRHIFTLADNRIARLEIRP